jgi:amino acid transporter
VLQGKIRMHIHGLWTTQRFFLLTCFFFCGGFFALGAYFEYNSLYSSIWDFGSLLVFSLFFSGIGVYLLWNESRNRYKNKQKATDKREILTIVSAIIALIVAIWVLFHFGAS